MLRPIAFTLLSTAGALTVALLACTGDDPVPFGGVSSPGFDSGGGSSGAGTSGTSGNASSTSSSASSSGLIDCDPPQQNCQNTCIDLHASKTNCGRCGRACGPGSDCISSACVPVQAVPTLQDIYALAATDTGVVVAYTPSSNASTVAICKNEAGCDANTLVPIKKGIENAVTMTALDKTIYFNDAPGGDNSFIRLCSVDGCPPAGPKDVEQITNDTPGVIAAGPNRVVWSRRGFNSSYFNSCALPEGCNATNPTITPVRTQNAHGSSTGYSGDPQRENISPTSMMSVGAKTVFWSTGGTPTDSSKFLAYCSLATPCNDGTLLDTGGASVRAMFHFGGTHYVATAAEQRNDIIYGFSDDTPSQTKALANDVKGIVAIAADSTGVYWANNSSGEILHCGNVADGCMSNEKLASGQTDVRFIAVNNKYVFWANTTQVFQVAK